MKINGNAIRQNLNLLETKINFMNLVVFVKNNHKINYHQIIAEKLILRQIKFVG